MISRINKVVTYLSKREKYLFFLTALINLFPLFSRPFYPFMDAPAHLYNSKLMYELVFNHNDFVREYVTFNPILVPNWIGHCIMFPLHSFFAPDQVEKTCLISYFLFFPLAFRYCSRAMQGNTWVSYLAFPLAYHTLIFFSFYNFSFGLIFLLLTLGYFYKKIMLNDARFVQYIAFALLLTITFFCHIVVLGVVWVGMALIYFTSLEKPLTISKFFSKKLGYVLLASIPSVVLVGLYLRAFHGVGGDYVYQDKWTLLVSLLSGGYLEAYGQAENLNAGIVAFIINGFFFVCMHVFFVRDQMFIARSRLAMGLLLLILVAAYFFLPDSDGVGGYISSRINILILVVVLLFLSQFQLSKSFATFLLLISLWAHYGRLYLFDSILIDRNKNVNSLRDQSAYIEPNSFLVFYKENEDWLDNHFYSYLCLDKPVLAVQNYECFTRYFPLVWKDTASARSLYEDLFLLRNIDQVKAKLKGRPVYYLLIGNTTNPNPTVAELKKKMDRNCVMLNVSDYAALYQLKRK